MSRATLMQHRETPDRPSSAPHARDPHARDPHARQGDAVEVAVKGLTKRFTIKGSPAVFEAGFTAPAGGVTTLLGPSGSGKTTLMRVVAGLEIPDDGVVTFGGVDVTRTPARERGVGFVFQGFALFDHMTVRKNIAFGLEVTGTPSREIKARVDELLGLVQLDGLGERYPRQLSGGQRQRVGFARALAPRPKLLLLDEPFGALDARVRVELRHWLRRLHAETHLTTILVTHDQEEALELSDVIVVMDKGRVLQIGSPQEIYDNPQSSFVASFVGTANVLSGRVQDGRVSVGDQALDSKGDLPEGARVHAIVRPHEVKITKAPSAPSTSLGRVDRIVSVGAAVKVDLVLPSDERVTVQMPRAELDALGIGVGDRVMVDLQAARVFVEDYAI